MDIALYYQEKGNKEPFILLHGNGQNGSYFKNQIDYFSNRYRVIALDTRGHGRSPRGTKPFTIEQFSCDLYDFMEELEISETIILGFSDGANIAKLFASKSPEAKKNAEMLGLMVNDPNIERNELSKITAPRS